MSSEQQQRPAGSAAILQWGDNGQPLSSEFDDVYFSRASGLEETRHVFLQHNRLAERWQQLKPHELFCIAETGFGTGLNFLCAWQLWQQSAPRDTRLHFVSAEKYPLKRDDLIRALALWPELNELSSALIEQYPRHLGVGFYRLNFGAIQLTLIIDDAAAGFAKLKRTDHPDFHINNQLIDAWFLDGFAPAKNPQMWRTELFARMAELSRPGATAATFTAAGIVKRGLTEAGFAIEKVKGFGRKREMIRADFSPAPSACEPQAVGAFNAPFSAPWHLPPAHHVTENTALVIGAGLAGCHSARALAERGFQVTLIERHQQIASEASGNPQGILYAKLSPRDEALSAYNLAALLYAQTHYRNYWHTGSQCGVLQLAHTEKEALLQQKLLTHFANSELVEFVDAERTGKLAGAEIGLGGLYFPGAGWLSPPKVCQQLIDHPNIRLINGVEITELRQLQGHWYALDSDENIVDSSPVAVICCANRAVQFEQTAHLPLKPIRGQVSYLPVTESSAKLQTVICAEGYLGPATGENFHSLGASFNLGETDLALTERDHRHNLNNLARYTPTLAGIFNEPQTHQLQGRAALRCTTPDYLPLVGPVPERSAFLEDYALLRKNTKASIPQLGHYHSGLYLNLGHGSRGLAYTPLASELLAAQICNEPSPLAASFTKALHPARFDVRGLIRNKL